MKKTYNIDSGLFGEKDGKMGIYLFLSKEDRIICFKKIIDKLNLNLDIGKINKELFKYGTSIKNTIRILKGYGFTYIDESKV